MTVLNLGKASGQSAWYCMRVYAGRKSRAEIATQSVTFTVGAPLCPYGFAYGKVCVLSTSGQFKKPRWSPLGGQGRDRLALGRRFEPVGVLLYAGVDCPANMAHKRQSRPDYKTVKARL